MVDQHDGTAQNADIAQHYDLIIVGGQRQHARLR